MSANIMISSIEENDYDDLSIMVGELLNGIMEKINQMGFKIMKDNNFLSFF